MTTFVRLPSSVPPSSRITYVWEWECLVQHLYTDCVMRKSWFYQHFVVSMKRAASKLPDIHIWQSHDGSTSAHSMFARPVYGGALLLLLIISIFIVTRTRSSSTPFIVLRRHENAVSCDCGQRSERPSGEWVVCIVRSNRLMFNFNLARGQSTSVQRERAIL